MFPGTTWTCHICGEERPDAFISVYKSKAKLCGVDVDQNVRYCNDRAECISGAPLHSFFPATQEKEAN